MNLGDRIVSKFLAVQNLVSHARQKFLRMIKIVDYGMGNLRSVQKAFEKLGAEAEICANPSELSGAEKLVLPGVGAFRDAIHELRRTGLDKPVLDHIAAGRPFLGICLGLQLLFDVSYEDGQWEGLGVIRRQSRAVPGPARSQDSPHGLEHARDCRLSSAV